MPEHDPPPAFIARKFELRDQEQVIALFVEGMSAYPEHKDSPEHVQYVHDSIKADLSNIHATYVATGGNFWVATPADRPSLVVGMVALELKPSSKEGESKKEGELRRMAVKGEYRRYGIGRLLTSTLEQWAATENFHKVWLTTGANMAKARAFYSAAGYAEADRVKIHDDFFSIKFEKVLSS